MIDHSLQCLRRMADASEAFSFWVSGSIEEAPAIELASWRVMQLEEGSRHLVGTSLTENSMGRVSSRIVTFDCVRAAAETDNGRVYRLVGSNGRSSDGDCVWRRWLEQAGSPAWMDVTCAVFEVIHRALPRRVS